MHETGWRTRRELAVDVLDKPAPEEEPIPEDGPARQDVGAAWIVLGAVIVCLAVVLLLNTKALIDVVDRRPSGPTRTVLLVVARTLDRAAVRVGLDRPAAWLDYAQVNRGEVPQFTDPRSRPPEPGATATITPLPVDAPLLTTAGASTAAAGIPSAAPATATATAGSPPTPTAVPLRAVTAADPLRVYVAGDSFVYSLAEVLAETGQRNRLVTALDDVHPSSGLATPAFFDWPARLRAALAKHPVPEAVVFMAGANDGVAMRTPMGEIAYGSEEWKAEYGRRAAEMMDIVGQQGARLYYIGQPVMRDSKQSRIADDINVAVARAAADRPWVTYIDSWSLLVDQNGEYSTFLVAANGETVKARADDGIHLTPISTIWVANAVYAAIREDWGLEK